MTKMNNAIANLVIDLDPFADDAGNVYICRPNGRVGDEEPETIESEVRPKIWTRKWRG